MHVIMLVLLIWLCPKFPCVFLDSLDLHPISRKRKGTSYKHTTHTVYIVYSIFRAFAEGINSLIFTDNLFHVRHCTRG